MFQSTFNNHHYSTVFATHVLSDVLQYSITSLKYRFNQRFFKFPTIQCIISNKISYVQFPKIQYCFYLIWLSTIQYCLQLKHFLINFQQYSICLVEYMFMFMYVLLKFCTNLVTNVLFNFQRYSTVLCMFS